MAGDDIASRSDVIDLRDRTLTVHAYDPGTAEVLNWSRQRILTGARAACPGESIDDLTVRVRRRATPRPDAQGH